MLIKQKARKHGVVKPGNYTSRQKILVAVDCIIFGFDGTQLKVLLIKRNFNPEKGKWSLIGGFITASESSEDAAARILFQLTGMKKIYMEQVYTFTALDRESSERVVSIAYFALIRIDAYSDELTDENSARWWSLEDLPPLIFDHEQMIRHAKQRLQEKGAAFPIGLELLPQKFTLRQLHNLYEAIYETAFDKRNLIKKMGALAMLNKLEEKEKGSSKKGSYYYEFNIERYKTLKSQALKLL